MRLVTKPVKTNPLNGMENYYSNTEKKVKQYRKWIAYNF